MDGISQWLWFANLAALAILIARLAIAGLHRVYPFLFVYFLVEIGGSLALTQIPLHTTSYANGYMAYQAMMHVLAILVVLEMYRVALSKQPGLASFGRASVLVVALCTLFVAAIGTLLDLNILKGQSAINHRFFTLERSMDFVIFLFLLLIVAFITWFPVALARNAVISIGGFSVYCFVRVAALLAMNLLPSRYYLIVNRSTLGASLTIFVIWFLTLRRNRLGADSVAGHAWDPAAWGRVSRQLDAINAALVRIGRR